MEKSIRTRSAVKDIKVLDRQAIAASSIRQACAKTKEVAENRDKSGEYAENEADNAGRGARGAAAHGSKESAKAATRSVRAVSKRIIQDKPKEIVSATSKSIKTASATGKTIKTSCQAAQGVRATTKGAQFVARKAALAARVTSRAALAATKTAAKAVAVFTKMAIAKAKSLVAAITAGGWVAVSIVLIVLLVGAIAASAFGIFFAGGDMGDGNPTLREVVADINQKHQDKIEEIKRQNPHDEVVLTGTRARWTEVLALYSVRTTANEDEPLDVLTLDEQRQQALEDIFWDMNTIESRVTEREVTEIAIGTDEDGNATEEYETRIVRTLSITLSGKTTDEIAQGYGFTEKQSSLLNEMLGAGFDGAWQSVLYDIRTGTGDIVEIAKGQLGNTGGVPYWSWYGFSSRVEWCACFVSWCANECGYIEAGIIPRHSYCQSGIAWFKDAGLWQDRTSGYEPHAGDIIYFEWGDGADADHVGIVEYVEGGRVYTIEGNSGDACARGNYDLNSSSVLGYGTPLY